MRLIMAFVVLVSPAAIVALLMGVGCTVSQSESPTYDRDKPIVRTAIGLERLETPEVVCFQSSRERGTLWCHWKGEPK